MNQSSTNSMQPVVGILKKTTSIRSNKKDGGRSSMGKDTTKVMSSNGGEIKEARDESSISYEDQMVGVGTVTSS
jgi:hypothetical protein